MGGDNSGSHARRMVEILFAADTPTRDREMIRRWMVGPEDDPDRAVDKQRALWDKFTENFRFNADPVLAPWLWPELALRLGLDRDLARTRPVELVGFALDNGAGDDGGDGGDGGGDDGEFGGDDGDGGGDDGGDVGGRRGRRKKGSPGPIAARIGVVVLPVAVAIASALWLTQGRVPAEDMVDGPGVALPETVQRVAPQLPSLRFESASLGELIEGIEANHGVRFQLAPGIDTAAGQYTADFEGLAIDALLEMLSLTDSGLDFVRDGDRVNVVKKR